MTTLLITGANRGIGLEHVRQGLAASDTVIAACRDPSASSELKRLLSQFGPASLRLESLDVANAASVSALAGRLKDVAIDVLINNAGIYGPASAPSWPEGAKFQTLEAMDYELWENILRINLFGPFRLTAALLPNLLASKRKLVAMMSSELGSIALNTMGSSHAYRSSKAALNMVAHGLAIELKDQGVTVISLAPGWTRTELGGTGGDWAIEDSVAAQRKVLAEVGLADSGQFINLTGETLPW